MSIIQHIYLQLLEFGPSRRRLRRLRALMQGWAGYTDPYYEIAKLTKLADANLFVDIGCHDGRTLRRFIESGVHTDVVAFDPLPGNIEKAKRTLSAYADSIQFVQAAMSDEDGEAKFYQNVNDQTSSLLENEKGNINSFKVETQHQAVLRVPTVKLDTWMRESGIEDPRLVIKCDTQGAEGKVIAGGLKSFGDCVHAFYGEVMLGEMYEGQASFQDLRQLLEHECGMVLKNIYPCMHDARGEAVQMDVLWVKRDYLR